VPRGAPGRNENGLDRPPSRWYATRPLRRSERWIRNGKQARRHHHFLIRRHPGTLVPPIANRKRTLTPSWTPPNFAHSCRRPPFRFPSLPFQARITRTSRTPSQPAAATSSNVVQSRTTHNTRQNKSRVSNFHSTLPFPPGFSSIAIASSSPFRHHHHPTPSSRIRSRPAIAGALFLPLRRRDRSCPRKCIVNRAKPQTVTAHNRLRVTARRFRQHNAGPPRGGARPTPRPASGQPCATMSSPPSRPISRAWSLASPTPPPPTTAPLPSRSRARGRAHLHGQPLRLPRQRERGLDKCTARTRRRPNCGHFRGHLPSAAASPSPSPAQAPPVVTGVRPLRAPSRVPPF